MAEESVDIAHAAQPALARRAIDTDGRSLREHAARGTLINSVFRVGLAGLGFVQRLVVAAFLTREELGLWGIILITVLTLSWLKQVGIVDKYVQQDDADQERAFQKTFTLELALSSAFFALVVIALPVYASIYSRPEIIVPSVLVAASVPISAFESPIWVSYRRMQFVRQRVLESIDPVVSVVVTIVLGALGAGYWCLVVGVLAGSVAGAAAATVTSPYPLRLRYDRSTLRQYATFSWPLFGYQLSSLVVVQGVIVLGSRTVGLAGLGAITLASSVSQLSERLDAIVSETLYPAVCAVADRTELLLETFIKSNRLALMWGLPFGVALALFASDLVHFGLGSEWLPAIGLLAAFGLIAGFGQIAFNWQVFMRAVNRTRPIFWSSLLNLLAFFVCIVPLTIAFGLAGYAAGQATAVAAQILMRGFFLRRLFPGFRLVRHLARSVVPSIPAAAVVLLARLLAPGDRSLGRALAELTAYVVVTVIATAYFERSLLSEMVGYLRGSGGVRTKAQALRRTEPREPSRA